MHYKKVKGILSSNNGMNLYRGCLHGCIYCDSRSDCYHMDHLFEDIEVKENALELLDTSLRRKRKPCMIGMGAMTDSYIPLEDKLFYTIRFYLKRLQLKSFLDNNLINNINNSRKNHYKYRIGFLIPEHKYTK